MFISGYPTARKLKFNRLQNINVGVELARAGSVTKGATQFILWLFVLLKFAYQTVDNEVDGRVEYRQIASNKVCQPLKKQTLLSVRSMVFLQGRRKKEYKHVNRKSYLTFHPLTCVIWRCLILIYVVFIRPGELYK